MNDRYISLFAVNRDGDFFFEDGRGLKYYHGSLTNNWVFNGRYKKDLLNDTGERISLCLSGGLLTRNNYIQYKGTKIYLHRDKNIHGYRCLFGDLEYVLYEHKVRRQSIFKEEQQIGYIELEKVHTPGQYFLSLHIDKHADIDLLVTFAYYLYCDFTSDANINFNSGFFIFGKEYRPFEQEWLAS